MVLYRMLLASSSDLAMEKGSIIYDTWNKKNTGLITDDHVLEYVFQGQYTSWAEFKKAMFTERLEKAATGQLKPFTMQYELGVADSTKEVTITSFEQLQNFDERGHGSRHPSEQPQLEQQSCSCTQSESLSSLDELYK